MGAQKVLVMLTNDFPSQSGDASFIQHEIDHLAEAFDRVLLFSFREPSGQLSTLPEKVEYVAALEKVKRTEAFNALSILPLLRQALVAFLKEARWRPDFRYMRLTVGNIFTGLRFGGAISKALAARGVTRKDSVVIYSFWASHAAMAMPFLNVARKRFLRLHGFDLYESRGAHQPLRASLFSAADALLPVSDYGRNYLESEYPELIEAEKLKVARLGTADRGLGPMSEFSEHDALRIVSCSSVVPLKRVKSILSAVELLSKKRPVEWTHFGSGPLMEELKEAAEAAQSQNLKVVLKGQTPNEDVIDYYKTHLVDVFVHASDSEGVPVSIMEALSFGIPVVATDAGGTGELVGEDKKTGILLPLRPSVEVLADALKKTSETREKFAPRKVWEEMADGNENGTRVARLLARSGARPRANVGSTGDGEENALLILSFSDISSDARVLKQVAEFARDFRVTTCGYGPKPQHAHRHIRVPDSKVFWAYDRIDLILRLYKRAYWSNAAVSFARDALAGERFDLVLANEIDAVPLALSLDPKFGVHADVHEYSPREKEDVLRWRLFVAPFRTWLSRKYLPLCSSVTTVNQGIADEYRKQFGFEADVVMNATPHHELAPTPVNRPIRLVHSGACLRDRDPMGMLEAVAATKNAVTLDLYLTPNDPGLLEEIRSRADDLPNVTVHDPVPYRELVPTLNNYDVGISVLPPVNFNHVWALPNKLFDYVQARIGAIVGPSPEMARIVRAYEFGHVMAGFSRDDLTKAVDALTVEQVSVWKQYSNRAADPLSAGPQVKKWREAIERLTT